jgi:hypothetical protein
MVLNLGSKLRDEVVVAESTSAPGYTDFELSVQGRLPGESDGPYTLVFRGYTDGMECTDFGQGNVWVFGFTARGHPVISTSLGPLEITDESLSVGCPGCIQVEIEREIRRYTSPAWDLSLTGHRLEDVRADDTGRAYLLQDGNCVELSVDDLFVRAPDEACSGTVPAVASQIKVDHGACT